VEEMGWREAGRYREERDVLGAQNLPDISMFNFPAKSPRMGAASSGDIAIVSASALPERRSGKVAGKRKGRIDVPPIFS